MRGRFLISAAVAASLTLGAMAPIASAATPKAKGHSVTISTRKVPGLGTVLVNSKGRTLYMFVPDKHKRVTCVKTCAAVWPPVFLPKNGKAVAKGQAKQKLLGSDKDPAGGRVVTYHGWPLYLYAGDTKAGVATGQDIDLNGGYWYVLNPSGGLIKHKA